MKNMTKHTKKNISGNNYYNTLKSDLNQRKYLMNIIFAVVHFIVIYSQLIILYQQTVVEVNAVSSIVQVVRKNPLHCAIIIEAESTKTTLLIPIFKKYSNSYLWFGSCSGSSKGSGYYALHSYFIHKVKNGLIQYNEDQQRDVVIRNLFDYAKEFLENNPRCGATAPLLFRASASFRFLNEKSQKIIDQVKTILIEYDTVFLFDDNSVAIMDGKNDGLYSWLTVNCLFGNLDRFTNTIAVLDLCESSLQITYYLSSGKPQNPNENCLKQYKIMGVERTFYNQSYIDFGLMEMRTKILKPNKTDESTFTSPCHHTIKKILHRFALKNYYFIGENVSTNHIENYNQCLAAVQSLVVNNVKHVILGNKPIIAISLFHVKAVEASLTDLYGRKVTIQKFREAALQCFQENFIDENPFKCFDLIYIYVLLNQGFGFPEKSSITIKRYYTKFEMTWALGAAYIALNEDI